MSRRGFLALAAACLGVPVSVSAQRGGSLRNRRVNPDFDRFSRMSAAERRRALEALPPDRRRQVEERYERYRALPPDERQRVDQRYQRFQQLSPERQERVRAAYQGFQQLPVERQQTIRDEARRLAALPEEKRRAEMKSKAFQERFRGPERRMMEDLSLLPPE